MEAGQNANVELVYFVYDGPTTENGLVSMEICYYASFLAPQLCFKTL